MVFKATWSLVATRSLIFVFVNQIIVRYHGCIFLSLTIFVIIYCLVIAVFCFDILYLLPDKSPNKIVYYVHLWK